MNPKTAGKLVNSCQILQGTAHLVSFKVTYPIVFAFKLDSNAPRISHRLAVLTVLHHSYSTAVPDLYIYVTIVRSD